MSQLFDEGSVGPITYEGRHLWLAYRIPVSPGDRLHLLFESHRSPPRQGIKVGCDNRRQRLRLNQEDANSFVFWADTAPRHIELQFLPPRAVGTVYLINTWQVPGYEGVHFRSINAASLAVSEPRANEWLLECSDGFGTEPPSFDDLVVRVVRESGLLAKE